MKKTIEAYGNDVIITEKEKKNPNWELNLVNLSSLLILFNVHLCCMNTGVPKWIKSQMDVDSISI